MSVPPIAVPAAAPLKDVARLFVVKQISGAPVIDERGSVIGVISETDLVRRASQERRGRRGERTERVPVSAAQCMTSPAITIGPQSDLRDAARLMFHNQVNRLPVLQGNKLVGVLTRADIVKSLLRPDQEIMDEIDYALRAVDGLIVESVTDGIVTLAGVVVHESLVRAAAAAVIDTAGVIAVDSSAVVVQHRP